MLFESFLDFFFEDPIASRSDLWFIGLKSIPMCVFFCGKVVIFLAKSYFSGIFRIFRGLFELDMLI